MQRKLSFVHSRDSVRKKTQGKFNWKEREKSKQKPVRRANQKQSYVKHSLIQGIQRTVVCMSCLINQSSHKWRGSERIEEETVIIFRRPFFSGRESGTESEGNQREMKKWIKEWIKEWMRIWCTRHFVFQEWRRTPSFVTCISRWYWMIPDYIHKFFHPPDIFMLVFLSFSYITHSFSSC